MNLILKFSLTLSVLVSLSVHATTIECGSETTSDKLKIYTQCEFPTIKEGDFGQNTALKDNTYVTLLWSLNWMYNTIYSGNADCSSITSTERKENSWFTGITTIKTRSIDFTWKDTIINFTRTTEFYEKPFKYGGSLSDSYKVTLIGKDDGEAYHHYDDEDCWIYDLDTY